MFGTDCVEKGKRAAERRDMKEPRDRKSNLMSDEQSVIVRIDRFKVWTIGLPVDTLVSPTHTNDP